MLSLKLDEVDKGHCTLDIHVGQVLNEYRKQINKYNL